MEIVDLLVQYPLTFIVGLSVLVFVHEFGHYIVARWAGVRVEVFSIGFGPEIYGLDDRHGTRWKFSAIPLGGFVKMFGEGSETLTDGSGAERPMSDAEKAVSFHHKPLGKRAAVVFAGPAANFLFTIVLLAGLFAAIGQDKPLAGIGHVLPDGAAIEAGFQAGDRVIGIDGREVRWFIELKEIVEANPETPLAFSVLRDDTIVTLTATPRATGEGPQRRGLLGVRPDPAQVETVSYGPLEAIGAAVVRTADMTWQILAFVGDMLSGNRGTEGLGGPLMIAKLMGDIAQAGFDKLLFLIAALSLNLGLINLFPIPMLDGGHLVYYAIEAVRGKPLGERAQEYGFRFGLVLVLALMVFATWNDLVNLQVVQFFKDLVS